MKINKEKGNIVLLADDEMDIYDLGRLSEQISLVGRVATRFDSNTDSPKMKFARMEICEKDFVKFLRRTKSPVPAPSVQ